MLYVDLFPKVHEAGCLRPVGSSMSKFSKVKGVIYMDEFVEILNTPTMWPVASLGLNARVKRCFLSHVAPWNREIYGHLQPIRSSGSLKALQQALF